MRCCADRNRDLRTELCHNERFALEMHRAAIPLKAISCIRTLESYSAGRSLSERLGKSVFVLHPWLYVALQFDRRRRLLRPTKLTVRAIMPAPAALPRPGTQSKCCQRAAYGIHGHVDVLGLWDA
jgi:hypothetical protein